MKKNKPPRLAEWILKRMDFYEYKFSSVDNFREDYHKILQESGWARAYIWYWMQVLMSIPYYNILSTYWGTVMFLNYFKVAIRNIVRHKIYSFINISGLSIGLACCLMIFFWVRDELSYDKFHDNYEDIYRVVQGKNSSFPVAVTPAPIGAALQDKYSEVEKFSRFKVLSGTLVRFDELSLLESRMFFVDPSFLDIFSFPLLKGINQEALTDPYSVIITTDMAEKYFGNTNPVGKSLNIDNRYDVNVTGIIDNVPSNSHMQFDFLIPFDLVEREYGWNITWNNNYYYTYLLLQKNYPYLELENKTEDFYESVYPANTTSLHIQPLSEIHLKSEFAIDLNGHSESKAIFVYFFSIIAVFVLMIACINFMNLTTARYGERAKEIGLRKVVGAQKRELIVQFLGESILQSIAAFIIGVGIVLVVMPTFGTLTGKDLSLSLLTELPVILSFIGIAVLTGLLAGSYPALYLSSFNPISVLRGTLNAGAKSSGIRKALVVAQFAISIILIASTIVINKQIDFMGDKNLGYSKDQVIYYSLRDGAENQFENVRLEFLKNPNIQSVTISSDIPTFTVHSTTNFDWDGRNPDFSVFVHHFAVDYDYIKTFEMEILDGRNFSRDFPTDEGQAYILNETAVKLMDISDPVGKRFAQWGREGTIIGIVKDFHFKSLHEPIEPLVLRFNPGWYDYAFLKINSENVQSTLSYIEEVVGRQNSGFPFEYHFLDESVEQLYDSETRLFSLVKLFSLLGIIISSLGLYGLVSYVTELRTKEIGIRKVLGASELKIIVLMFKELAYWVVLANIIAWPLAQTALNSWLQTFAYRTSISWSTFALSGLFAFLIAVVTVLYQTYKAAKANPIDSLRYN